MGSRSFARPSRSKGGASRFFRPSLLAAVLLLLLPALSCGPIEEDGEHLAAPLPSAPMWMLQEGSTQADLDGDGVPDLEDNCPQDYNQGQMDSDGNGIGDVCEGLGIPMDEFPEPNLLAFETYGKWSKLHIRWALEGWPGDLTKDEARGAIATAFDTWAEVSALSFERVDDPAAADIVLRMRPPGSHDCECPFGTSTIAHSFFPNKLNPVCPFGQLHFNESYEFTLEDRASSWQPIDYRSLALHELGHALGLSHSANNKAVMWKYYAGTRLELDADDIAGIQSLYGGPAGCKPWKTCADYPGQCGAKSDGCETTLNCFCEAAHMCAGGLCVDPCKDVLCDACQMCNGGLCVPDPTDNGGYCKTKEGGKKGACKDGICVDACSTVSCDQCSKCEGGECVVDPHKNGKGCNTVGGAFGICAGGACVDACTGVDCGPCSHCVNGKCAPDSASDGKPCELPGEKSGACSGGACVPAGGSAPEPEPDPEPGPDPEPAAWLGEPSWAGANCVVAGTKTTMCVETSGLAGAELRFGVFEADPSKWDFVAELAAVVKADAGSGKTTTCLTWTAAWTYDGWGSPEYLLEVETDGQAPVSMEESMDRFLHVGYWWAPSGSYCKGGG